MFPELEKFGARTLFKMSFPSEDEPFVEVVELEDEQVVDMSMNDSTFLAGVDFVESAVVVGLKTHAPPPRDESC